MITNKNEAKAMIEHVSCDCKCKKIIVGILAHVFVKIVSI